MVPPTLLSAFQLPQSTLLTLTQYAFLATALACFAQAFCGHRRAIMEGPGGLWWGTILTIRGVGLITLICGVNTLIPQYLVAVNLGAELPAFAGSLVSLIVIVFMAKNRQ